MQIYLVGGAVRDALMGLPVADRDWAVVGSTPQAMLAGYYGFAVHAAPEVSLAQDLARRDLTINSIAARQ